jgi:Uma2 family endonuclease
MSIATGPVPDALPVPLPQVELIETDGEPLESPWHRKGMNVLVDSVEYRYQGRNDYYVGGNMFIYFSEEQARKRDYRGPDFFFIDGVNRWPERRYWVVWQEDGRYPDVIIELLSATTAVIDRTIKKDLYEQTFHTHEYYCYDPDTRHLEGWRLGECRRYKPITPDERGWLWCEVLGLWLGTWTGAIVETEATWLRFYDNTGQVVPLEAEAAEHRAEQERQRADAERQRAEQERQRAEAESQRAEAERQRAETLATELAQLKARLAELEGKP